MPPLRGWLLSVQFIGYNQITPSALKQARGHVRIVKMYEYPFPQSRRDDRIIDANEFFATQSRRDGRIIGCDEKKIKNPEGMT